MDQQQTHEYILYQTLRSFNKIICVSQVTIYLVTFQPSFSFLFFFQQKYGGNFYKYLNRFEQSHDSSMLSFHVLGIACYYFQHKNVWRLNFLFSVSHTLMRLMHVIVSENCDMRIPSSICLNNSYPFFLESDELMNDL